MSELKLSPIIKTLLLSEKLISFKVCSKILGLGFAINISSDITIASKNFAILDCLILLFWTEVSPLVTIASLKDLLRVSISSRLLSYKNDALAKFSIYEFANSYIENLANASFLYDNSLELIETLNKSFRLAIVTNGLTSVQNKRIRQSSIAKFFDAIVISEEILIAKPNPKIFEHTLKLINFSDKSKVLMIGDSLSSDIQGGINFGIDTCWYNPNKIINETSIKPTYEISNFDELKLLLLNS